MQPQAATASGPGNLPGQAFDNLIGNKASGTRGLERVGAYRRRTMPRILQLSDLHLTPKFERRAWRADVWAGLHRALVEAERLEPIDRLVLSGDIANRPSRRAYSRLREALSPWLDRVRILPGNHDGRRALCEVFADRLESGSANFIDTVGAWRMLGLDSKRSPFVHGKLGRKQLAWLRARLDEDARPTLLFWHHPPIRVGTWWLDKDRLRDAAKLAKIVEGSSVSAIFCGHVHQVFDGEFAGVPFHTSPSTAYQFEPGSRRPAAIAARHPAGRIIDLSDDGRAHEITTRAVAWP